MRIRFERKKAEPLNGIPPFSALVAGACRVNILRLVYASAVSSRAARFSIRRGPDPCVHSRCGCALGAAALSVARAASVDPMMRQIQSRVGRKGVSTINMPKKRLPDSTPRFELQPYSERSLDAASRTSPELFRRGIGEESRHRGPRCHSCPRNRALASEVRSPSTPSCRKTRSTGSFVPCVGAAARFTSNVARRRIRE